MADVTDREKLAAMIDEVRGHLQAHAGPTRGETPMVTPVPIALEDLQALVQSAQMRANREGYEAGYRHATENARGEQKERETLGVLVGLDFARAAMADDTLPALERLNEVHATIMLDGLHGERKARLAEFDQFRGAMR